MPINIYIYIDIRLEYDKHAIETLKSQMGLAAITPYLYAAEILCHASSLFSSFFLLFFHRWWYYMMILRDENGRPFEKDIYAVIVFIIITRPPAMAFPSASGMAISRYIGICFRFNAFSSFSYHAETRHTRHYEAAHILLHITATYHTPSLFFDEILRHTYATTEAAAFIMAFLFFALTI